MTQPSERETAQADRQPDHRGRRGDFLLDTELADLPPELRWREWMGRVEAVIFAASEPVSRDVLARVVGRDCSIDLLIGDIREDLRCRPYELVTVAGGWQHRTRRGYADVIRTATGQGASASAQSRPLSQLESLVLISVAYYQPVTRAELGQIFGKEVSRDTIAFLRGLGFIVSGPRSPKPGAPYTYVTTDAFLAHFGLNTLRDLPNLEALEDAGLLSKAKLMVGSGGGEFPGAVDENTDDG